MEKAAAVTLILTVLLILLRGKCAGVEVYGAFLSGEIEADAAHAVERAGLRVGRVRLLAQQAAGDDPDLDGAIRARVGSARLPGLGLGCEGCIAHGTLLRRRFVRMLRRIPETRGE